MLGSNSTIVYEKRDELGNKLGKDTCTLSKWNKTKASHKEKGIVCSIKQILKKGTRVT